MQKLLENLNYMYERFHDFLTFIEFQRASETSTDLAHFTS